jgi:hypothetical protein
MQFGKYIIPINLESAIRLILRRAAPEQVVRIMGETLMISPGSNVSVTDAMRLWLGS